MTKTSTAAPVLSTAAVAQRFDTLAAAEKWFEIQDELFADDVQSMEPGDSPYFSNASGKTAVRKKGEDWVKRITAVHHTQTGKPVVAGNHFVVSRSVDITVEGHGRIQTDELMLYRVQGGKIVSEQFFY